MSAPPTAGPSWRRVALGGGGGMFVGMGLGRFSYTAMVPAMIQSGQLTEVEAGYVGGLNLAGFLLGAFLSERLRRAVPIRTLLAVTLWLSFVALLASAVPWGFAWLAVWRGFLGVTTALIMVQSLALATDAAPHDRRAAAAGIVFAAVGLGIFLSGTLVPWLLEIGLATAWSGVALAGFCGVVLALWGWSRIDTGPDDVSDSIAILPRHWAWRGLLGAHFMFSFGIVPHTLYWIDYLVRGVGLGISAAGIHWSVVRIAAVAGPWAAAWLARRFGVVRSLVLSFLLVGGGIAGPGFITLVPVLWLSTMLFGTQPGLGTVIAARARDLGTAVDATSRTMRAMILSNALGAAAGGLTIPLVFDLTGSYAVLFLLGGGAMAVGVVLSLLPEGGN